MRAFNVILLLSFTASITGCTHVAVRHEADDHYYRLVSFPTVALKTNAGERIESVEVVVSCGRFAAINRIPSDWSAQVVSPVSEVTTLRMEAGHGSTALWRSTKRAA